MNTNSDWNIRSRSSTCQACGREFVDRQVCHTFLSFEPEGYQRFDLCDDCFRKPPPAESIRGFWKGIYRVPPPPERKLASNEDVESLLRRLIQEQDSGQTAMIFVLAVMLERKRVLIERAVHTEPDGIRRYVYEHRKSGDTFVVVDPELPLDGLDELEARVADRLKSPAPATTNARSRDHHTSGTDF